MKLPVPEGYAVWYLSVFIIGTRDYSWLQKRERKQTDGMPRFEDKRLLLFDKRWFVFCCIFFESDEDRESFKLKVMNSGLWSWETEKGRKKERERQW